jgi:DNA-nicking Smr family endonuclease
MAMRSKRRPRRQRGEHVPANNASGSPLISAEDRALFRRVLAASVARSVADSAAAEPPAAPKTVTDATLFAQAVSDVAPLSVDRMPPQRRPLAPRPISSQQLLHASEHRQQAMIFGGFEGEVAERLWFARSGLQESLLRKLRRGRLPPEAELDLHGMFVAEAHQAVDELIQEALAREVRCVRIIHGKGNRSQAQQPVLKGNVDRWLRARDEVLAFASAPAEQGGSGAVLVLLKRR